MDPGTQALFGAVVGQAGFSRTLGTKRAIIAGALIATAPDLDIFILTDNPASGWLYHRAITHSVVAGPFFGAALGWLAWLFYRRRAQTQPDLQPLASKAALVQWLWLGVIAFTTHAWLDLMTPYGTQLLSPLSNARFAVNAMPVIDIIYTAILIAAVVLGLVAARPGSRITISPRNIGGAALALSLIWQVYGWGVNLRAIEHARADLKRQEIGFVRIRAFPIMLQPWLRRITAETADAHHIAYWSPLADDDRQDMQWSAYPKQSHPLIEAVAATQFYRDFYWFASGEIFWRIREMPGDILRIEAHDLRYIYTTASDMHGIWGIYALIGPDGKLLNTPERFSNRPSLSATAELLRQAFSRD